MIPLTPGPAEAFALARAVRRQTYPSAQSILAACEGFYGCDHGAILTRSRTAHVARARMVAMFLVRSVLHLSYPATGREFGGRDHTTVMSAVARIGDQLHRDAELRREVEELCAILSVAPVTQLREVTP
jgi:chromosomal replication initiator protein